jgi:DNA-binding GntR family transcriptional regulator
MRSNQSKQYKLPAAPSVIDSSDLTTKVYQWLKDAILHHAYPPGTKLDIQQLSEQLGVSRTPVKDSVNRLAAEGLVVLHSRRGTYVATLTEAEHMELVQTRLMIETWVAEQASPERITDLRPVVERIQLQAEPLINVPDWSQFDYPEFFALDIALHEVIISLASNNTVAELYRLVHDRMRIGRIYFRNQQDAYRRSQSAHAEHSVIVQAFREADPALLKEAVRRHILASGEYTNGLLRQYSP